MHGKQKKKKRLFAISEKAEERFYKKELNKMAKRMGSKKRRKK